MRLNSIRKILLLFAIVSCIATVHCQTLQNPIFWQAPRLFNASDLATDSISLDNSAEFAFSEDFQTIYAGGDVDNLERRLVIDFSYCCNSTDTTYDMLQQRNGNSLDHALVQQKPKIALIQRGHCNWSQKIQTVMNVSSANDLKVSAAIVYDNVTRQDAGFVIKPSSGFRGIGPYDSTLPTNRNISSMSDNDLSNASLRIPVYFVPKDYGDALLNASNIDPAYPGYTELMQLCAYLDGAWFTNGKGNPSVWVISRGYLSYVIALAAVFLIALFAGIIFLRWWRVRQLREQREYEAQLGGHAYNMQLRGRQAKPLPVDIVNSFPIETYTVDRVKNANCAICLEDFVENSTEVRILGCGHGFCVLCIDPWLTQKSTVCPMCKYDCLPPERRRQEEEQEAAEAADASAIASSSRSAGDSSRVALEGNSSEIQQQTVAEANTPTNNLAATEQHGSENARSSAAHDQPVVINIAANDSNDASQIRTTPTNTSAAGTANNYEQSSTTANHEHKVDTQNPANQGER